MGAAAAPDLDRLFRARSIAIVGASATAVRPGARCYTNLRKFGYGGDVFLINEKYEHLYEMPCYPDLAALPQAVDLVVAAVPAAALPAVTQQAVTAGAAGMVVFSSGFAEQGDDGTQRQRELTALARANGLALLGPNTAGFADLASGVVASFTSALDDADAVIKAGPVAVVSQSGAISAALYARLQAEGLGCAAFVGTGNEAVIDAASVIGYYAQRPDVTAIVTYLESIRDGRALTEACRAATAAGKMVSALKVGRSQAGQTMMASHTAALASDDAAFDIEMRRAGVAVATTLDDLFDHAAGGSCHFQRTGKRIGIASLSGGAAVMYSDAAEDAGLSIPRFGATTIAALGELVPGYVKHDNPVDFGPLASDPEKILRCVEIVGQDPDVDQVAVSIGLSPFLRPYLGTRLRDIRTATGKPVMLAWLGGPADGVASVRAAGVPAYADPWRVISYARAQAGPAPAAAQADEPLPERSRLAWERFARWAGRPGTGIATLETVELLRAHGIDLVPTHFVPADSADLPVLAAGPFAVKAEAPGLIHKTDAAAVAVNVAADGLRAAIDRVTANASAAGFQPSGAIVQPMAAPGVEMIIGVHRDETFGMVVVVGSGGVLAEVLADSVTLPATVSRADIAAAIGSLAGARLLHGFRGAPAADAEALVTLVARVCEFARSAEVSGAPLLSLDLNPVLVHTCGAGLSLVDAAAVTGEPFH